MKFATHHNATADAGAKRDHHCVLCTSCSTNLPLAVGGHCGIVFNMHIDTEPAAQFGSNGNILRSTHIGRSLNDAVGGDKAGNSDAERRTSVELNEHRLQ